jgi:uncharacterized pyridoxamine 5'-phosphate oxidase family protein
MAKVKNNSPRATRPHIPGYGVPKSKRGLLPWKWAENRLNKTREYWIATTRPDGRPHVMVVWALWMNGCIYFSTGANTVKARNLAQNPHCTMCADNAAEAVIVEGVVEAERNVDTIRKYVPLYEKKYKFKLGEMGENLVALKDPLFSLRPTTVFGFWEKKFSTSATRWIFK